MVAALYVAADGPYIGLEDVDPWTEERDARLYRGPWPVVAHPPCERWGRYWSGGPSAKVKRELGADGGCFAAALAAVVNFGGVLEHPAHSHAWPAYGLIEPPAGGGWLRTLFWPTAWVCHVEQGHYGHPARKPTWLFHVTFKPMDEPPRLIWGPCSGKRRLDEGFHSSEERRAARAAGRKPIPRLSRRENLHTPEPFRDVLLAIARGCR